MSDEPLVQWLYAPQVEFAHLPIEQIFTVVQRKSGKEFKSRSRDKVAYTGDVTYRD